MTTTTADRVQATRKRLPRVAPIAAAVAALLVTPASRADWRFVPSLGVTQTFSDNAALLPDDAAHSQWITEVAPGFSYVLDSRRLKATANGSVRQYAYSGSSDALTPRNDRLATYAASLQGVVAEDLLYVDATAGSSQQSTSAFGPQFANPYSALNRTEVKTWSISPYLVHKFGNQVTTLLRLTRDSVKTDESNLFGDSLADSVLFNVNNYTSVHKLVGGLSYLRQNQSNALAGDSSTENLNGNLRYRLDSSFALTAMTGYDRYDYNSLGGRTEGRSWSTGFAWTPSQRTSIEASFGRHFYGKTGSLAASVRSRRSVWSVNYDDSITNSRQQFTLPSAIDTARLLDSLFSASIPDPVLRQQAVQAYLLQTGLPPSLADNVNYLSNRYMRQKLLQASSAFKWARSSLVLSASASERTALSSQESDSALLGGTLASLNDNVRQHGASALFTYNLSARSNLFANANYATSKSLSTGLEDSQRLLRVGINRRLGRHVQATLDLNRRSGGFDGVTPRNYTEHAIAATLSMTL